jgi:hypothetical protein|tara:strand:- start:263 stop:721 length:459 start_codon:yes stop_codon:yes gene_type:complete
MIIDSLNEFADASSVAAAAGTTLVGNVIDLGVQPQDLGNGEPMYLIITVGTGIITAGAAGTIAFSLVSDAAAAIATNGTATTHISTGTFVTGATAIDGTVFVGAVPTGAGKVYERYLGVLSTVGTTATSAGTINAFLTRDPSAWKAYADGTN